MKKRTTGGSQLHLREKRIFKVIESVIICDAIRNGYYTWLKSPRGEPMQLDWYCNCGIEVAFEIQGVQHYKFVKFFHKTRENFEYQQLCDKAKKDKCKKRGVFLFIIDDKVKVNRKYIFSLIKEASILPELVKRRAISRRILEEFI
jgi:hypothetical protein